MGALILKDSDPEYEELVRSMLVPEVPGSSDCVFTGTKSPVVSLAGDDIFLAGDVSQGSSCMCEVVL